MFRVISEKTRVSEGYRVHIGSPEGVPGTPGKNMGLMAKGGTDQPTRGWCTPPPGRPAKSLLPSPPQGIKERGGATSPFLPLAPIQGKGAEPGQKPKWDSAPLGVPLGLSPLPPTYIYEEGFQTSPWRLHLPRYVSPS